MQGKGLRPSLPMPTPDSKAFLHIQGCWEGADPTWCLVSLVSSLHLLLGSMSTWLARIGSTWARATPWDG